MIPKGGCEGITLCQGSSQEGKEAVMSQKGNGILGGGNRRGFHHQGSQPWPLLLNLSDRGGR